VTSACRRIPDTERPGSQSPSRSADRSAVSYVRQARSLRGRHRKNSARLHDALRVLNARRSTPAADAASPEQAFYAAADAAFDGSTLRYSKRLELLTLAHRLGIPPFRGSLIIASVEHRRAAVPEAGASRGWIIAVSIGVLLQAAILLAAFRLLAQIP
jgi:hypothetical protein